VSQAEQTAESRLLLIEQRLDRLELAVTEMRALMVGDDDFNAIGDGLVDLVNEIRHAQTNMAAERAWNQ